MGTDSKISNPYKVVRSDSLFSIAKKLGLHPPEEWAKKIWEDSRNSSMHAKGKMPNGKIVKRQLHMGNNEYSAYDHNKYLEKGNYRGFLKPDQIILYAGETIWIPKKNKTSNKITGPIDPSRIHHKIRNKELIDGFESEAGKRYELEFPNYIIRIFEKPADVSISVKYTLFSTDFGQFYKRTLSPIDNVNPAGHIIELHFYCTPTNLFYTFNVEGELDNSGKSIPAYYAFEECEFKGKSG